MYNRPDWLHDSEEPYKVVIEFVWGDRHIIPYDKDYIEPPIPKRLYRSDTGFRVSAKVRASLYASDCRQNGVTIKEAGSEFHIPVTSIKYIRVSPA